MSAVIVMKFIQYRIYSEKWKISIWFDKLIHQQNSLVSLQSVCKKVNNSYFLYVIEFNLHFIGLGKNIPLIIIIIIIIIINIIIIIIIIYEIVHKYK